jgi:hypothetical protein
MGWIFYNGRLIAPSGESWIARSGPWGNGQLPDGLYTIGTAGPVPKSRGSSYRDATNFSWWCPIVPRFSTKRTGIGIHPDGNVPGTLGCIGIVNGNTRSLYNTLVNAYGDTLLVGRL